MTDQKKLARKQKSSLHQNKKRGKYSSDVNDNRISNHLTHDENEDVDMLAANEFGSGNLYNEDKASQFKGSSYCVEGIIIWISSGESNNQIHAQIVTELKEMLDKHNVLAKNFLMVRDRFQAEQSTNVKLRLIGRRGSDGRRYNLPSVSEVAALVVGDFEPTNIDRDNNRKSKWTTSENK
ncbi:hypothetical protein KY284_030129 [Solanum tuberosum]|nr:hypothetical protein KY284_030129 [Solanum tuberosum]